jgi:hypothetical protein
MNDRLWFCVYAAPLVILPAICPSYGNPFPADSALPLRSIAELAAAFRISVAEWDSLLGIVTVCSEPLHAGCPRLDVTIAGGGPGQASHFAIRSAGNALPALTTIAPILRIKGVRA